MIQCSSHVTPTLLTIMKAIRRSTTVPARLGDLPTSSGRQFMAEEKVAESDRSSFFPDKSTNPNFTEQQL